MAILWLKLSVAPLLKFSTEKEAKTYCVIVSTFHAVSFRDQQIGIYQAKTIIFPDNTLVHQPTDVDNLTQCLSMWSL